MTKGTIDYSTTVIAVEPWRAEALKYDGHVDHFYIYDLFNLESYCLNLSRGMVTERSRSAPRLYGGSYFDY